LVGTTYINLQAAWAALIIMSLQIWRAYVVYSESFKVIIASSVLFLGNIFCAAYATQLQAPLNSANLALVRQIPAYMTAFWTLTVAQNLITTCKQACATPGSRAQLTIRMHSAALLIWKIWRVDRGNKRLNGTGPSSLTRVLHTIAGSGLLYTIAASFLLGFQVSGSNAVFPVSAIVRIGSVQ
jgi:hypothetical protein